MPFVSNIDDKYPFYKLLRNVHQNTYQMHLSVVMSHDFHSLASGS